MIIAFYSLYLLNVSMSGHLVIEGVRSDHNPILDGVRVVNCNGFPTSVGGSKVYHVRGTARTASHFMDVEMPDGTFTVDGDKHDFYEIRLTAAIQEDFMENHRGKHVAQMDLLSEMRNVKDDVSRLLILLGNKDFACGDPSILGMFTNYTDYVRTLCVSQAATVPSLLTSLRKVKYDNARLAILKHAKTIAKHDVVPILRLFDWESGRVDALKIIVKKVNVVAIEDAILGLFEFSWTEEEAVNAINGWDD